MYKDLRNDKANPILYFRIIKHHKRLVGDSISLNLWQLMELVGTEVHLENYEKKLPDDCITYIKMCDFGINKLYEPSDIEKKVYPWKRLSESIEKLGLKIPIIAERLVKKNGGYAYRALEGKHKLAAVAMVRPFDPGRLVPCLVIEYDPEHTYMRHVSKRPIRE